MSVTLDQTRGELTSARAQLAQANSNIQTLSTKLNAEDSALKAAGDTGTKAEALAADLAQTEADLAAARDQAAQAQKAQEALAAKLAASQAALDSEGPRGGSVLRAPGA
jgi:predicted  nucleic acid-binding Zn-ribbon protein